MLRHALERPGHTVLEARDQPEAVRLMQQNQPSLVLSDLRLPEGDGFGVLRASKEIDPDVPVIVMTAYGSIEDAVSAMKEGALDFLAKPVDPDHLMLLVSRALEQRRLVTENLLMKEELAIRRGAPQLVGEDPSLRKLVAALQRAAATDTTVLIEGESGTGKELFARSLHALSQRADAPFVAINCAAIPENLLETELFGYEKGAFTGALSRRAGYFELANGGTIFLDEIAEMSNGLQAKYLRPLQDGMVRRLGGSGEVKVDVRVMAATNQNVAQAMRDGTFRDDLYYRINVLNIPMPALRRRPEDIPGLVEAFVAEANQKYNRQIESVDDSAMKRLREHSWPGNVRELKNVIERAVIATPNGTITAQCLFLSPGGKTRSEDQRTDVVLPLGTTLDASERELIVKTLASLNGNKTRAAHVLGVSVKTLHNKLRRWRLA
jgi:DNA-binding NtrC family response regulator